MQDTRQCLNGALKRSKTNVLYLCVSGRWNKLCSNLWGNLQAAVACRQLSQNPLAQYNDTGICLLCLAYLTFINLIVTGFFYNYIRCTGQEKNITECEFTSVRDNECTTCITPVKLICQKGKTLTYS